jgi:hypothetical protein
MSRRVVLDSGAVSLLAGRSARSAALYRRLLRSGPWPPIVPSVVLVECLTGDPKRDAQAQRLLNTCEVSEEIPVWTARRSARLRCLARRGSAVDAVVVANAEPGGVVITGDVKDLTALAYHAVGVEVREI